MGIKETETEYGRLVVADTAGIYRRAVELTEDQRKRTPAGRFVSALSGGSTPQDWFRWCVSGRMLRPEAVATAHFTVSDERLVPLADPQSNFGTASRLLLDPLGVAAGHRHPWPVELGPEAAADRHARDMAGILGAGSGYSVCMLGMGADAHTASFFPGSPLLENDGGRLFSAILTRDKGWRLTITPSGLRACGLVLVMVTGAGKAPALARVFGETCTPRTLPAQILRTCADRVVWLVDEAASAGLRP